MVQVESAPSGPVPNRRPRRDLAAARR
jgi:hypothetical protein